MFRAQVGGRGVLRWALTILGVIGATLVALAAVQASQASAARGLETALYDDGFLDGQRGPGVFDRAKKARAGLVRIPVRWRSVAPRRPASPCNPSDGAYRFGRVDQAVRGARQRGLDVLLTLTQAPDWAEGPGRPKKGRRIAPGAWKPDPKAYRGFACAVARRYSGNFPTAALPSQRLPRVRYYESFNEPNLPSHLAPQWRKGKLRSVKIYRRLLNGLYKEVKDVRSSNRIVAPSLAPFGKAPRGAKKRPGTGTKPVYFLRKLFCLRGNLKSAKKCPKRKLPRLDVVSHHPINPAGGPRQRASDPLNATAGDMPKVRRIARAAERAGNIRSPGKRRPLWVTEFWWQSNPPAKSNSVPVRKHARYVARALQVFWRARVDLALNFLVEDGALKTGLYFANGKPKPALRAFRFPLVADRKGKRKVRVWGKSPRKGRVAIQRKTRRGWRRVGRAKVSKGDVFNKKLRLKGKQRLRAKVRSETSRVWRVGG